jgi:hypothetical protein
MRFAVTRVVLGVALFVALPSTPALAHWCDDLWSSAYDIVVRADSDTSPKEIYVQNRWGYQLTNFKLTATTSGGGSVTLTAPSTLKVKDTLLPGEKGTWKIASGNPAKVEDLVFHVTFGNTSGSLSKQYACYPVQDASPVMIVKADGSLFPNKIAGIPTNGTDPKPNTANGCTYGDVALGRSLQLQTVADWEDVNVGLDNLLTLYCAGRGSWGNNDKTVKPNSYCKDSSSTTCPTTRPTASPASRSDYMRLWGAGALAIRKSSLAARLPVFRERLKCGANDADPGVAGYTLFVLGYLGADDGAKSFLETQAKLTGDIGTIAKAALYLMGDTTQKADVQAGAKSSSVWIKVACAGALGIVDKDDASVASIIPEVKWIEPDNMGGDTDNGKGMYSAHILEIVAMDRRGWIFRGNGDGPVTFYGEPAGSTGGTSGTAGTTGGGSGGAGATGNRDGGRDAQPGTGGTAGGGAGRSGGAGAGAGGSAGSGGSSGAGGSAGSSGQATGGTGQGTGGKAGSGGGTASASTGGSGGGGNGTGGNAGSSESTGGAAGTTKAQDNGNGCKCNLGGHAPVSALSLLALAGLALLQARRRRS